MRFDVVEAKARHVGYVVHRLRTAHRRYVESLGLDPHRELRKAFDLSSFRKTWMVDGVPAAVGGVSGSLMCSTGVVWVAFTEEATRLPIAIMREARRQLRVLTATRHELNSAIMLCDPAAWRFAAALGFFVKHPSMAADAPRLPMESHKTSPECILRAAPEFRIEMPGRGAGVLVGYQGD